MASFRWGVTARLLLGLTCPVGVVSAQSAAPPILSPLERLLSAEAARMPAHVGIYVKHLGTGEEATLKADETFNSASTRKIATMIMAFEMAEQGRLDLDERIAIPRSAFRTGSGVLQYHRPGSSLTVRDLITQMIITSDNIATFLVVKRLGGPEAVNRWIRDVGFQHTTTTDGPIEGTRRLFATLGEEFTKLTDEEVTGLERLRTGSPLYRDYEDLFTGPKAALADRVRSEGTRLAASVRDRDPFDRDYWTGSTSPREMGRLLESMATGRAASKAASDEMQFILQQQQIGQRRIPHFLGNLTVGHKTGDAGTVANDVGLIYTPNGIIVVAFLVMDIRGQYGQVEDQIGQLSRLIVDYFD